MPVSDYEPIIQAASREWNVDPNLIKAVGQQESGWNPNTATGGAGEEGLTQFTPATAQSVGVTDRKDPTQSIYGTAKHLSDLLDKYKKPELAIAAYNAGSGAVDAHLAGKPLPASTANTYIPSVVAYYKKFAGATPAAATPARPAANDVPSDADFLKATSGAPAPAAAVPSDDEFLSATGGSAKPAAVAPVEAKLPVATTADGIPGTNPTPTGPPPMQQNPLERIGNAIASPWTEGGPLGPDTSKGQFYNGPMGLVNKLAVAGPLSVLDAAGRVVQSAARGAGALAGSVYEANGGSQGMGNRLERDISQLPDALAPLGMGSPAGEVNRLVEAPKPYTAMADRPGATLPPPNVYVNGMPRAAGAVEPAATVNIPTPRAAVSGTPGTLPTIEVRPTQEAANPLTAAPAAAPDAALAPGVDTGRKSVGAAAASDSEANMPRAEMIAQRATAEQAKLTEPQPLGVDASDYVPGVNPTEAHMVQNARTSRNEKLTASEMPEGFSDNAKLNNETRLNFYDDTAGTPTLQRRLVEDRSAQADADLKATWADKSEADPQPVLDTANSILKSPDGRRPAVRTAVNSVLSELKDEDGKLITDPEMLYGVRKHIDDLLSPAAAKDNPLSTRVTAQLLDLKSSLDETIEKAAPGFKQYLNNFSEASKPIDEMNLLQQYKPKIVDSQNRITYSGMQRMMKDIVADRSSSKLNEAHAISDETMTKLWNLRDDLRRVASSDDLAKARGSDTVQNLMDFGKKAAQTVGIGALHGAANYLAPGVGSLGVNTLVNNARLRSVAGDAKRALAPDRNKLVPPPP